MSKDLLEIMQHNLGAHRECSSTASKKDHGYFGKEERDFFFFNSQLLLNIKYSTIYLFNI